MDLPVQIIVSVLESGAVFTVIAYIISFFKKRYTNRIARLDLIRDSIKKNRYDYSLRMMDYYRKRKDDGWSEFSHLLSKEDWITDEPVLLNNSSTGSIDNKSNKVPDPKLVIECPEESTFVEKNKTDVKLISCHDAFLDYIHDRYLPEDNLGPLNRLKNVFGNEYAGSFSYNVRRFRKESMFNGDIYTINKIEGSVKGSTPTLKITVFKTHYFSYFDTCEYIAHYNAARLDEGKDPVLIELDKFDRRASGIGLCTLAIFENLDETNGTSSYFAVHHRSGEVSVAANSVSIAPAGSFAPLDGTGEIGEVIGNIIREFEEELFDHCEVEYPSSYTIPSEFKDGKKINADFVKFYYVSMGFDPLSTNMEMITLMTINANDLNFKNMVKADMQRRGQEYKDKDWGVRMLAKFFTDNHSKEGSIELIPYTQDMLEKHSKNKKAMPVFRETMRLMSEYYKRADKSKIIGKDDF